MPYKRNDGKWTGQVRRKGVRKERKFDTKKEATDWEVQQWKIPDDHWGINNPITSLTDWANDYLDFAKSKHSPKTYDEKRVAFRRLFEVVDPAAPVACLSKGQVLDFLQTKMKPDPDTQPIRTGKIWLRHGTGALSIASFRL